MRIFLLLTLISFLSFTGCETMHKGTKAAGGALGEGAKIVGGVSEGGAEVMRGGETPEENPYGR
ncbi:MAG: hypothetical protein P9M07_00305 [Candidatus Aceula meridiana]|nr:hypothetical protein [Candidatus Aceula meridiana]